MLKNQALINSPMESIFFAGRKIFLKRDDLLDHAFNGNKARKLACFLQAEFKTVEKLIGYGSVQANSFYSLAALAKLKGWQFDFYVTRIPTWLKQNPNGNYQAAMKLGAEVIEVDSLIGNNLDDYMLHKFNNVTDNMLFVPEGGRCSYAEPGVKQLALEIIEFCRENNWQQAKIMLPAGTGTTALFLQKDLPFEVLTCACVGDMDYLKKQFALLEQDQNKWPTILVNKKKYHFSKLYPEFYNIWLDLKQQTGIEFDLLYDPLGWISFMDYLKQNPEKEQLIYIHQGGILGNDSMIKRYLRKFHK